MNDKNSLHGLEKSTSSIHFHMGELKFTSVVTIYRNKSTNLIDEGTSLIDEDLIVFPSPYH